MKQCSFARALGTNVVYALFAAAAVALSACGGGGSGGHDLTVGFSYTSATTNLFATTSGMPQFTGLEGNSPHCKVTVGTLPPGISLAGDCSVIGAPLQVGVFAATVELTVDGFSGSVSTSLQLVVNTPTLAAISTSNLVGAPNQVVQVGSTIQSLPVVTLRNYATQKGDVVQYRVATGSAPAGLVLSATDGTLSGIPSGIGETSATVELAITHAGVTFVTAPVSVTIRSEEAALVLSYGTCCASVVGDAVSVDPTTTYVPVPGSSTLFESIGPLPPGIAVDSATGRLSGTLTVGGAYSANVRQTVSLSGVTIASTVTTFAWNVAGFSIQYPYINLSVHPNTPFSLSPTSVTGLRPSDTYTFSIAPYPGSTYTGNTLSGTPVPPWLSIDAVTGVIYGTGPATAPISYQWELNAVLTVHRNGQAFQATQVFYAFLL